MFVIETMGLDEITQSQQGIRVKEGRGPNLEEHLMMWGRKLACQEKKEDSSAGRQRKSYAMNNREKNIQGECQVLT